MPRFSDVFLRKTAFVVIFQTMIGIFFVVFLFLYFLSVFDEIKIRLLANASTDVVAGTLLEIEQLFYISWLLIGLLSVWIGSQYLRKNVFKKRSSLLMEFGCGDLDDIKHLERDELILRIMEDGLCVLDKNFHILFVNPAGRQIIGRLSSALVGRSFFTATGFTRLNQSKGSDPSKYFDFTKLDHGSLKFDGGVFFENSEGINTELNLTATPINVSGELDGIVLLFRDVTISKETDRMKSEFLSVVSHQLRTPLTAIRWFNEMLSNGDIGKLTKDQKETLMQMHDSVIRMISLVNALLNVSRIESGGIPVDPRPTNFESLIKNLLPEFKSEIEQKKITCTLTVSSDIGLVTIDSVLITEVYVNLITNALKYTQPGGVISIDVTLDKDMVVSKIADTGTGIPEGKKKNIFQKYFGAEQVFLLDSEGSGLGLYIAKTIIETANGKIWFESQKGVGTTFFFTIPKTGMIKRKGEKEFLINSAKGL